METGWWLEHRDGGWSAMCRGTASSARKREVLSSSKAELSPKVSTCIVPHRSRFSELKSSFSRSYECRMIIYTSVAVPEFIPNHQNYTNNQHLHLHRSTADQRTYITIPSAHLLTKHQHPPPWAAHPATARADPAIKWTAVDAQAPETRRLPLLTRITAARRARAAMHLGRCMRLLRARLAMGLARFFLQA